MSSQAFLGIGTQLQRGNDASPQLFVKISEGTSLKMPKGSRADVDVTNFDSEGGYTEYIAGLREGGEISFEANFVPADATLGDLEDDFDGDNAARPWRVAFYRGAVLLVTYEFDAYVKSLEVNVTPKDAVKVTGALKISGPVGRV